MPFTAFTGNDQQLGEAFHQPSHIPCVLSDTALSTLSTEDAFSAEGEKEKYESDKKVKEGTVAELSASELILQLHQVRLARQVQTQACLAEVMDRMVEKNMMRHRWLPEQIAQPLRTFYTRAGFFDNITQAVLFTLGVFALLVALFLGLWWHYSS